MTIHLESLYLRTMFPLGANMQLTMVPKLPPPNVENMKTSDRTFINGIPD